MMKLVNPELNMLVWSLLKPASGPPSTPGPKPVPVSVAICGLEGSESRILSVPVMGPPADGTKFTVMTQLAPTSNVLGQVLNLENPVVTFTPLMVSAAALLLVTVNFCPGLIRPSGSTLKFALVGNSVIPALVSTFELTRTS